MGDQLATPINALEQLSANGVGVASREWAHELTEHNSRLTSKLNEQNQLLKNLDNMINDYSLEKDLPTGINERIKKRIIIIFF